MGLRCECGTGNGVERNLEQARRWNELAAKQGREEAKAKKLRSSSSSSHRPVISSMG